MNNNSSKQVLLSVIGVAILVVAVVGVSFAFFSYVYNGQTANEVKTGTIVFTASDSQLKLTNVFPTDGAYEDHNDDVVTATVSVQGSTTYEKGIKFTVRAKEVTNADADIVPTVLVTPQNVADITYSVGTAGTATEYNATNKLINDTVLCSGTIAANKTIGSATALVPVLEIKAFYDKNDYHISQNSLDELSAAGLLSADYKGTIIHPDKWNAMAGTTDSPKTAYSFKIQVTAVEGDSADPRVTVTP